MYPQVFGKYVLERELSRGGMARVVLATLRGAGGFEKRLVVKQIRDELAFDQQFVRRFVEEAKTTVALSHPNIVPVYELGVEQGTYFLAMELVEGVSIAELVRERDASGKKRVLTPEEGAYVGMEVCRALDYAHRRMKVVHRDITPRNVMLDEEGQVKLIDFGIAAPARVAGHEILGSPGHMPPEQVDGKELGPPTDIFAVAVLLMEAWSGTAPFRRATPEECDAAMREPHPKPSDFDPRLAPLDDAIVRAMKLDPKDRQQQASDLGRALRKFLSGLDVSDVARALGDRVRALRERQDEAEPASGMSLPRPAQGSQVEVGTRTFAAREDAIAWVAPEPGVSVDRTPSAPRTRKLADSIPPPDVAPRRDAGLSVPTPLMIQTGVTADVVAAAARDARERAAAKKAEEDEGARRSSPPIETIATRPLETPVRAVTSSGAGEETAPKAKPRPWLVPAAVVGLAAIGLVAWRARGAAEPPRDGGRTATTATATVSAEPTATATATTPMNVPSTTAIVKAPPSGEPTGRVAPPPVTPVATSIPSGSGASTTAAGRAQATFLGDPGTRVSIDGAARGPCPVRVALDPGTHDIRFVFDPTGESRGERVTLKAGERVTVRADFAGATPTIRVQR